MILSDLIKEELVEIDLKAQDNLEAIRFLYKKLYENKYVKESFLQGIIERENNFPTGIQLGAKYNVAIPHTEGEHVIKSAIAIGVLKEPISFQRMDSPEEKVLVNTIFMIALNEREKQVEVLEKLVGLFTDEDFMNDVIKAQSSKEIVDLFKSAENK
ncbi:PTS sugar transporter subunit IIA [Clostridium polynesiense]|uniref:PTS sugar transporter subunit IIA n=1 Tax=Clostridium polynesiense TaxID=1325933 RepID=UPI00058F75AF|nr:PTS sugar transporter subunit IIA [Clostridium polynesiense]